MKKIFENEYKLIIKKHIHGWSAKNIAQSLNVNTNTIYVWLKKYEKERLDKMRISDSKKQRQDNFSFKQYLSESKNSYERNVKYVK